MSKTVAGSRNVMRRMKHIGALTIAATMTMAGMISVGTMPAQAETLPLFSLDASAVDDNIVLDQPTGLNVAISGASWGAGDTYVYDLPEGLDFTDLNNTSLSATSKGTEVTAKVSAKTKNGGTVTFAFPQDQPTNPKPSYSASVMLWGYGSKAGTYQLSDDTSITVDSASLGYPDEGLTAGDGWTWWSKAYYRSSGILDPDQLGKSRNIALSIETVGACSTQDFVMYMYDNNGKTALPSGAWNEGECSGDDDSGSKDITIYWPSIESDGPVSFGFEFKSSTIDGLEVTGIPLSKATLDLSLASGSGSGNNYVTPVAPELVPSEDCDTEATVTIPDTEGITYNQTREGNTITVTATANDGYTLTEGATTTWTFDVTGKTCPVPNTDVTPVAPELVPAEDCETEATVTIPDTEGITYNQTREGNTITVTATANDGYTLTEGATTTWTFDVTGKTCPVPNTDPTPSSTEKPAIPTTQAKNTVDKLAFTGASVAPFIVTGLLMVAGGLVIRRRVNA